ncbi:hypothetical protein BWK59_01335 [Flavobacterium davisii]|uniref:Glycosyl transferase family 1 domain-containing protein n=1 Tax=Flavobacterium davisii TaxID=2906077 RepID=A0A2D0AIZ9_9FLAO|nr:glycosyltransferase family 4 protein [Flavobacterium davisii]OWP85213.1 hypothetical protein BWK59_01335 [Flavobacterium davisii]
MKKHKKILIIGPFNEKGGREIEASFLYNIFKEKYDVTIASTEILSDNSLIYKLTKSDKIFSKLKRTGVLFKILNFLFNGKVWFKLNKKFRFSNYEKLIKEADVIFILAQVISSNVKKIIEISSNYNKKIIFRTTGTNPVFNIQYLDIQLLTCLMKVDVYVHHSVQNCERLKKTFNHNFEIIDQTIYSNKKINKFKTIKNINEFYCASRIDKNKNLEIVIKVFNELKNVDVILHIYGDGDDLEYVKSLSNSDKILFHGYLEHEELMIKLAEHDCLIISSFEESGPYTALEAMAYSRLILSTHVGAMNERLERAPYAWQFDSNCSESLKSRILELTNYNQEKINIIQKYLRKMYFSNYSSKNIKKKYLRLIEKYC